MVDISGNIRYIKSLIPGHVKLVAVSKMKPVCDIQEAYNAGQRCFGENRVQEILNKKDLLPSDIEWHLIGHLQSNKVKAIIPYVSMIESVDTFKLLSTVNSEALKISRVVDCLVQIYIADEETKFGFSLNELTEIGDSKSFENLKNVRICGVMGMATFTTDMVKVKNEFSYLADCFNTLKRRYFSDSPHFKEISMGMSGDYEEAIREGSTMVRVGSLIFGERIKI
jgi:pyridoxal phosphate enzyme (YggS family)